MNSKISSSNTPTLLEIDLNRTERPHHQDKTFDWERDDLVHIGQRRSKWGQALSKLSPSLKASFKDNLISFSKQGDYSSYSYVALFAAINTALKRSPAGVFDINWISQALTNSSINRHKTGITKFFLHWQERDSAAINLDALRLLNDAAACRPGPRNVLSDNPEKSWLTDEEYEGLLSAVWSNYDNDISSTQVTLIRLLSMQYARRPIQIAHLKVGDIRENDGPEHQNNARGIISFPGAKDSSAENDFRDSKFETHPLADHLWDLCCIQRQEVKALYEHTLGLALTEDQLKKLPLFCHEARVEEARKLIEGHYQLSLPDNLESRLFHLRKERICQILRWVENTPTCSYGRKGSARALRPIPPISPRTGRTMVVTATRMRHTRARQLARRGIPEHMLSHWLGHTSSKSLAAYYNDPAEQARQLDEAMAPVLAPLAMAFTGVLIDSEDHTTWASDPTRKLEFARADELKCIGRCGKHSFCATTSVPIPCYRCKYFEPLVDAPHQQVLEALLQRQLAEEQTLKIGGPRNLLVPIDLSVDIRAVENCINRCNARKLERAMNQ
ncbi:TPA: site-specific integrase [Pseudomonas aeruginosa]|nr:site-specific integrase [Pseudomonas aeruginosa]